MSKRLAAPLTVLVVLLVPSAAAAGVRDRNHDGIPDRWERGHHLSTARNVAKDDPDHDGLSNLREYRLHTNPRRADTDGDGFSDGAEVRAGTNPRDRASHPRRPAVVVTPPVPAPVPVAAPAPVPAAAPAAAVVSAPTPVATPTPEPTATATPTPTPTATATPSPVHCDLDATPATFGAAVAAATAGQTICLATGDYGIWAGTDKAITVRPEDGATPSMGLWFVDGTGNFTLDGGRTSFDQAWGLKIDQDGGSPNIGAGAHDITIKNADFSVGLYIDNVTNGNILLDHNVHHSLNGYQEPAAIYLGYGSDVPTGVTVEHSLFRDMSSDGIRDGAAMTIRDNEFSHVDPLEAGGDENLHTDAVQPLTGCSGGSGTVITGNYFHDGEQAIGAFDGTCAMTIQDNVIQDFTAHQITLGGDNPGSLVSHNTIVGAESQIDCSSKHGAPPSLTTITDNIASDIVLQADEGSVDCTPATQTNNMLTRGATGGDFLGTPEFVGGARPTTYDGFTLAPGSPGKGAATDGLDVGVRFGRG